MSPPSAEMMMADHVTSSEVLSITFAEEGDVIMDIIKLWMGDSYSFVQTITGCNFLQQHHRQSGIIKDEIHKS